MKRQTLNSKVQKQSDIASSKDQSVLRPFGRTAFCWICDGLLLDSGGDPSRMRNEHHVIPRAFGGEDGPTVSLDSAHHDLLHLVADKISAGTPWKHLVEAMAPLHKSRAVYLATRVVVAAKTIANDPNKRLHIMISPSRQQDAKIRQLAKLYSCSKADLLLGLVDAEFIRRFQTRK